MFYDRIDLKIYLISKINFKNYKIKLNFWPESTKILNVSYYFPRPLVNFINIIFIRGWEFQIWRSILQEIY